MVLVFIGKQATSQLLSFSEGAQFSADTWVSFSLLHSWEAKPVCVCALAVLNIALLFFCLASFRLHEAKGIQFGSGVQF